MGICRGNKSSLAEPKRLHKITSPGIENISIRSVFSKLSSKQPDNFLQQPIMTQNPPCNTLATVQTSNIERPDPSVTHHDVYPEIDCNQTTKEKTQPSFVEKSEKNRNHTKSSMARLIRHSSRDSTKQTNPEKYNRRTQQIMNLATQLAVKELLKSKCLVQVIK